jgi:hypothetical protein
MLNVLGLIMQFSTRGMCTQGGTIAPQRGTQTLKFSDIFPLGVCEYLKVQNPWSNTYTIQINNTIITS